MPDRRDRREHRTVLRELGFPTGPGPVQVAAPITVVPSRAARTGIAKRRSGIGVVSRKAKGAPA